MANQLQLRRGTAAAVAAFTGAQAEPVVDTDNMRLIISDGLNAGGVPVAKLSETLTNTYVSVLDANYTVQITDRAVAYNTLTAARTITLPLASTFPTGTPLIIIDAHGNLSTAKAITINPHAGDTIVGVSSIGMNIAYDCVILMSNGDNIWNIVNIPNRNLDGNRLVTLSYNTTVTIPLYGSSIKFTGSGGFTATLPNPGTNLGYTPSLDLWNSTAGVITLSAASGNFVGPKGSNASTMTMAAGTTLYVEWDGVNFVAKR